MENNSTYYNGSVPEYELPIEIGKQKDDEDILVEEESIINDWEKHQRLLLSKFKLQKLVDSGIFPKFTSFFDYNLITISRTNHRKSLPYIK